MREQGMDNSAVQRKVERDYRWNFTVNTLDGASFWFSMSFISPTVILPLFVRHFTHDPLLIGFIPFLTTAGYLLPQLFIANAVERAPRKKFFPVNIGFFLERMPIVLMGPAALLLALTHPTLALVAFFLLYAWFRIGAGVIIVGWQDMIAKIIPVVRRGRFFGITNFIGTGTGIIGAAALPFVLHRFAFPEGFVISFGVAAVFILISWGFLTLTREPAVSSSKPHLSLLQHLRSLPAVVRRDHNFRKYLLAQIVFALGSMATGFLVVYAVKRWNVSDAVAGAYTIALQVGLAVANLVFGFLADRKGHKLTLEIGFILVTLTPLVAILAAGPLWFFPILFMQGAVQAVTFISGVSIVYEFTDAENRGTYIGLANTVPGVSAAIAPLVGGALAAAAGYRLMFAVAAVIGAVSWALLHFAVHEPRTVGSSSGGSAPSTEH